ncbi:MAG: nuclear transport factor 2 family protein [Gemmatimonadaceae bacterium]|nr:nuclear transport factor 2 family protein [Gemmatimonadaceae bacterium]
MNLRAAAAIAVVVVASLGGATAFAQTAGDRRLVDRLVTRWERSWNTYDLREVDSVFWSDRSVTYFSSERAGLIRGIDALREHHAGFGFVAGGKAVRTRLWLTDTTTRWHSGVATVLATWHFRREDGTTQSGPVTLVISPRGRGFRITHAHFANAPPVAPPPPPR